MNLNSKSRMVHYIIYIFFGWFDSLLHKVFKQLHVHISIVLTHWGWVTHICISKLSITGSDNGLLPGRHQAIIWTNAEILSIKPIGTNFNEILIKIHKFSFNKMHLQMSSGKWQPFCLSLCSLVQDQMSGFLVAWGSIFFRDTYTIRKI